MTLRETRSGEEAPDSTSAGEQPSVVGRYELERQLGAGGMGIVYAANDPHLNRTVAIKLLSADRTGFEAQAKLLREAQAMAQLSHPNVTAVHDVGVHGTDVFIAMEYIDGVTLTEWLAAKDRSWRERWSMFREAGLGLAAAHAKGIIHCDFKSDNVLVDGDERVRVADFGLASFAESGEEGAGNASRAGIAKRIRGTPRYMSPEQHRGAPPDARSDQFTFCVVLFEALVGQPLFGGRSPEELAAEASADVHDASSRLVAARLPNWVSSAILRGLSVNPSDRFTDMSALLAAVDDEDSANPFRGLRPFSEDDSTRFFGRTSDVEALERMFESQALAVLVGPSGVGKSSLLFAGLIPALRASERDLEVIALRPGRDPLARLEQLMMPNKAPKILVAIDQFEELYRGEIEDAERAEFVVRLRELAENDDRVRVALTLRSDFLDQVAAEDRGFVPLLTKGLFFVPPIGLEGLRSALTNPVRRAGYEFEDAGMVEHIVATASETRSGLPLLQFMGARLWAARDRERKLLTRASYEELGGIEGALANHADSTLATIDSERHQLVRRVFERLVTPQRARTSVSLAELDELDPRWARHVVEHFATARLLSIEKNVDDQNVELVHESLISRWPTLRRWLDERREDAELVGRLRNAAKVWDTGGRGDGALWRDLMASEAVRVRARLAGELPKLELEYLDAVIALRERARVRRRRVAVAALAGLVLTSAIMAILAWRAHSASKSAKQEASRADTASVHARSQATKAEVEAARARDATRMAVALQLKADPTTALAVLREVEYPARIAGWDRLARDLSHHEVAARVFQSESDEELSTFSSRDLGHSFVWLSETSDGGVELRSSKGSSVRLIGRLPTEIYGGAISFDGGRIVVSEVSGTVHVVTLNERGIAVAKRETLEHPKRVLFHNLNDDATRLVTASEDGVARIWNIGSREPPILLKGHSGWVSSAALSPSQQQVATSSYDGTARLWAATSPARSTRLVGHSGRVNSIAYSDDGTKVVTASFDGTAMVWSTAVDRLGLRLAVLRGHDDWLFRAAFSRDGSRVITASADGSVRVWALESSAPPIVLEGHTDWVYGAIFDPSGRKALSWSKDGSARLWDLASGEARVFAHTDQVADAAFSNDDRRILTRSFDGTSRVWDVRPSRQALVVSTKPAAAVAFSHDGARLVVASTTGAAILGRGTGSAPTALRGNQEPVLAAAFSSDDLLVATASGDKAMLWDAETGQRLEVFEGHEGPVTWVRFSHDDQTLVTASRDKTARLWSIKSSAPPIVLSGHSDWLNSAEFSPDDSAVVTFSHDQTARVWLRDGSLSVVFRGHTDRVFRGGFHPDGTTIASSSGDRTIRIWNADTGATVRVLRGHTDSVLHASFSPDGERIASGGSDHTIRVWSLASESDPVVLSGHKDQVETVAFSHDGEALVSAARDGVVVWPAPSAKVSMNELWARSRYCLPTRLRRLRLGEDRAAATVGFEACKAKMATLESSRPRR